MPAPKKAMEVGLKQGNSIMGEGGSTEIWLWGMGVAV